jgi:protein-tyrosine phosphatase
MEAFLASIRRMSGGPFSDPPIPLTHTLLVGPGVYLTPSFVKTNEIENIINVAEEVSCPRWARLSFGKRYKHLPMDDSEKESLNRIYAQFAAALDSSKGRTYVHCHAGMNRSVSMSIAYILRKYNVQIEDVVGFAARHRPCILTNPHFNKQLLEISKKK